MTTKKNLKNSESKNPNQHVNADKIDQVRDSSRAGKDMATNQGYSNQGGSNGQAVKGAVRGHRNR